MPGVWRWLLVCWKICPPLHSYRPCSALFAVVPAPILKLPAAAISYCVFLIMHFFPFSFASIHFCVSLSNTCPFNSSFLPARLFACSSSRKTELDFMKFYISEWGTRWRSWLRHSATSRKVASSILDSVIGIFCWQIPSGHSVALGSTQTLTEMSTRNISWGVKVAGV
jgi:hypothetical protein